MRRLLFGVIFSIAAGAAASCRRASAPAAALPDFALAAARPDGTGAPLRRADLLGRPWVAGFIFTACSGPCPRVTAAMAELLPRLPRDAGLLAVSVDPERDSPAVLAAYARARRADWARWVFLTGPRAEISRLLREGFRVAAAEDPSAPAGARVTHSTKLVLLDREARVRGWYSFDDPGELQRLAADAAAL